MSDVQKRAHAEMSPFVHMTTRDHLRKLTAISEEFGGYEELRMPTDEQIGLLAETMCAAFHSDDPIPPNTIVSPVWEGLSGRQRGNWKRAARAAIRTLDGNRHWLPTPPTKRGDE